MPEYCSFKNIEIDFEILFQKFEFSERSRLEKRQTGLSCFSKKCYGSLIDVKKFIDELKID